MLISAYSKFKMTKLSSGNSRGHWSSGNAPTKADETGPCDSKSG